MIESLMHISKHDEYTGCQYRNSFTCVKIQDSITIADISILHKNKDQSLDYISTPKACSSNCVDCCVFYPSYQQIGRH